MEMVQAGVQPAARPLRITVDECRVRWQTGEPLLVVDARRQADWEGSPLQVEHARRLDPERLPAALTWPKGCFIMVYCH